MVSARSVIPPKRDYFEPEPSLHRATQAFTCRPSALCGMSACHRSGGQSGVGSKGLYPQSARVDNRRAITLGAPAQRQSSVHTFCSESHPVPISPSRLRYVGLQPVRKVSPSDLLDTFQLSQRRQAVLRKLTPENSQRKAIALPDENSQLQDALSCSASHPLLKQALLLIEAAEVEGRSALCQEEMYAFDTVLALSSISKEVEIVRVAAFEMFHFERHTRRALKRQEKRERRMLWLWWMECFEDAVLSEEIRHIQRRGENSKPRTVSSLLRSRSVSLSSQEADIFLEAAHQRQSSASLQIERVGDTVNGGIGHLCRATPLTHSIGDTGFKVQRSQRASTSNNSLAENCTSSENSIHSSRGSSDSVILTGRDNFLQRSFGHPHQSLCGMEAALESRIAQQTASWPYHNRS